MKKFLAAILLALSCVCTVFAFACANKTTTYTVTFDANGGTFEGPQTVTVQAGDAVAEPNVEPVKEGEDFLFWAIDGSEYDFSYVVNNDITLTAVYSGDLSGAADYTVTFAEIDGVKYKSDIKSGSKVFKNTVINFSVDCGAYYIIDTENFKVFANGEQLIASQGIYSVTVENKDVEIWVEGVIQDQPVIEGPGTGVGENVFWLSSPTDVKYIADRINEGDPNFMGKYYGLNNDIDFKGEEFPIIGDGSTNNSYFNGYFTGNGHVLKNFVINATDTTYVGIFGIVQFNGEDSNGGTLYNVQIKDYVINATITSSYTSDYAIGVGGLVGFGYGANAWACRSINGEINVYGNENNPAYVGGLFGIQQSAYFPEYDVRFISSVAYANVDVDIYANSGLVFAAGGLSGYTFAEDETATAYIANSYTRGTITGAIRSGGLVGTMGAYTSIVSSYSLSDVYAQTSRTDTQFIPEFSYASAGGLAGYAENETIISDSFATGDIDAVAALSGHANVGDILGGFDVANTATSSANAAIVHNCYHEKDGVDLDSREFAINVLKWPDYDWIYSGEPDPEEEGGLLIDPDINAPIKYPVTNFAQFDNDTFNITIDYNGKTVSGRESNSIVIDGYHVPFGFWYLNEDIEEFFNADDGMQSYGYFMDEECTIPVPFAYVATRNVTVYVGFKDYSEIAGSYYIVDGTTSKLLTITLYADGTFSYPDGDTTAYSNFVYNGEYIILKDARLARFATDRIGISLDGGMTTITVIDTLELMDFRANITQNGLEIYDGTYLLQNKPLKANKTYNLKGEYFATIEGKPVVIEFLTDTTGKYAGQAFTYELDPNGMLFITVGEDILTGSVNANKVITLSGATLNTYDVYEGVWEISATVNKQYYFDGMGNWQYSYYEYVSSGYTSSDNIIESASGTYTVNADETLTLSNGATVSFDENGMLVIVKDGLAQTYSKQYGFKGTWNSIVNGSVSDEIILTLNGINFSGEGTGKLEYVGVDKYDITYSVYGANVISVFVDGEVYGVFTFNRTSNTFSANMYLASTAAISTVQFVRYDDYLGEWISESDLFELVTFNGYGTYEYVAEGISGEVQIGDTFTKYTLKNSTLNGSFELNGVEYTIAYDEATQTITISNGNNVVTLERKDIFGYQTLTDEEGNTYKFDGYGNLSKGGILTVVDENGDETEYGYKVNGDGANVYIKGTQTLYATIERSELTYKYTVGATTSDLYIYSNFTGIWAINEAYNTLEVDSMNLNGIMKGKYLETEVEITLIDEETATFNYQGTKLYLFWLGGEKTKNIAITPSENLGIGDYVFAVSTDDLFGKNLNLIVTRNGQITRQSMLQFDGTGYSEYTFGFALITTKLSNSATPSQTAYYYRYVNGSYIMWTADETSTVQYYKLVACEATAEGAYVDEEAGVAYLLVEIDSLYGTIAYGENGEEYLFDGMSFGNTKGTVTVSKDGEVVRTYQYDIISFNPDKTATIIFYDGETEIDVTLDYSVEGHYTLSFDE